MVVEEKLSVFQLQIECAIEIISIQFSHKSKNVMLLSEYILHTNKCTYTFPKNLEKNYTTYLYCYIISPHIFYV